MEIDWQGGVDALSFDCYGTLIDWETGIVEALGGFSSRAKQSDERLLESFARHETAVQSEAPAALYPQVLGETLVRMGQELGCVPSGDEVRAFSRSVAEWPAFADSAEALEQLSRRFLLAVLSNIDEKSLQASTALLGDPFEIVCTAEAIGSYKPDPANFEYLLERLGRRGIAPGRLVHVAQSRYHDIVPAAGLGLRTVWVDRRGGAGEGGATPAAEAVDPDVVVGSMAELARIALSAD